MPLNKWLSLFEFQQTKPNEEIYHWLAEYGSMTEQITAHANKPLDVDVITSKYLSPRREELLMLGLSERRWAYVREVIMRIGEEPWMFGRTIIPSITMAGSGRQLKLLGKKPLGKMLFNRKGNTRHFIEIAKISSRNSLFPSMIDNRQFSHLWARRSIFLFQKQPILVQEVFLPNGPLLGLN